jgi:hypothetical protein
LAPGAVKPIAEAPQMGSGDPSLSLPITTQALGESLIRIPHLLEISDNYVRISLVTWNPPAFGFVHHCRRQLGERE